MRYERKFSFNNSQLEDIRCFLLVNNFRIQFPKRQVSSIYYDTNEFDSYKDSENGNYFRKKIRYRIYNYNEKDFLIEKKIKESNLGKKENIEIIKEVIFEKIFIPKLTNKNYIKIPKTIYNNFYPKVFVDYSRFYLISFDQRVRITLDFNISSSRILKNNSNNLEIKNHIPFNDSILEIKYSKDVNLNDKFIKKLSSIFNFNLSRNSKYCRAIRTQFL